MSWDRSNRKPHFPLVGKALECDMEILSSFSFTKRTPEGPELNDLLQQQCKTEDNTQFLMMFGICNFCNSIFGVESMPYAMIVCNYCADNAHAGLPGGHAKNHWWG